MLIDLRRASEEYEWTWPKTATKGDENSITFRLRRISRDSRRQIEDKTATGNQDGQFELRTGTVRVMKIEAAVIGCENIKDPDGKPISFTRQALLDALALMPNDVENELAAHIDHFNNLGAEAAKKYEMP